MLIVVLALLKTMSLLAARRRLSADYKRTLIPQFMMVLTAVVGVMIILLTLPIDAQTRGQVLGLFGVVFTGIIAFSSTTFVTNALAGLMLRLIRKPNVNWMGLRPTFLLLSGVLIAASLFVFFARNDPENSKYDIEFTGGTSVQVNLKEDMGIQEVRDTLAAVGEERNEPAIAGANVYSIEKSMRRYEITTTATNETRVRVKPAEGEAMGVEGVAEAIRQRRCILCESTKMCVNKTGLCASCYLDLSPQEKRIADDEARHKMVELKVIDDRWERREDQ